MMDNPVKIDVEYLGDLHCKVKHGPSGQEFLTDAPLDNMGKGEFFSPTDLAVTSVGACVATIMGILAQKYNIDIKGMKIQILKEMQHEPVRRIKRITLDFLFPHSLTDREFTMLRNVINVCPVTQSFDPEVEMLPTYRFADSDKVIVGREL